MGTNTNFYCSKTSSHQHQKQIMKKENNYKSLLSFDYISKVIIVFVSSFYIQTVNGSHSREVFFSRYVWLPQLIICVLLLITNTLSFFLLRNKKSEESNRKFLFGDVFILTTIDKLLSIGCNGHLIIFFITR